MQARTLTGELRRLRVGEHGGEAGEAMPVAVEDGVLGRLLAAKSHGQHTALESEAFSKVISDHGWTKKKRKKKTHGSPAEDGGEHAVVQVPDQLRVQIRVPLPHVHNLHLQIDAPRKKQINQQNTQP